MRVSPSSGPRLPLVVLACAVAVLSLTRPTAARGARTPVHLRLQNSQPASGETLSVAPAAIRLWFSEEPEMAVTRIKLSDAKTSLVMLGRATHAKGTSNPVEVTIKGRLEPGTYTVSFKTSSDDGHPVRGEYSFVLKASPPRKT